MDKISVIIPVYNVEPYIRRCLDSVIAQTYAKLEIICVNDGSTDNSGKICDEYAEKDSRIKVFHKENGGLSSARNVGLENFTGQYAGFVDSDDWIEPDMYETLYQAIKSNNAAVSVCGFFTDTDSETIARTNKNKIPAGIIPQKDALTYIFSLDCYNAFHIVVWNKLYSAKLLLDNNLRFDASIKFGEDNLFTSCVLFTENCTAVYTEKPLYHYYQRGSSLINATSIEIREKNILTAFERVINLCGEKGFEELLTLIKKEYCYNASLLAEMAIKNNDRCAAGRLQEKTRLYFPEYIEINKEFPERIERIENLLNYGK